MHNKSYEFLPHTADIKIRAYGSTLEELFTHAMQAMFATAGPLKSKHGNHANHAIVLKATNTAYLLIDFLAECLYLSDAHNEAYEEIEFKELTPMTLVAGITGYPIDGFSITEIKAVTYHDVSVEQVNGIWQATFVLDI